MTLRMKLLYLVSGLAVALVAVASIAQAVRQGSWAPIIEVGWLPAVIIAIWPGTRRRCVPRRRNAGG
ncbi:MAG TPA: hypothetical protein VIX86_17275 [Streptosporangiaceae bacterium]